MMPLDLRRRFYAEEIAATSNLQNRAVIEALASLPREQFLGAGPWTVRGEADFQGPPRRTPDADPSHVYHNYAVALDDTRQLFNGAPGLLAMAIDRLALKPGDRALHLGTGTGYYTAVMAYCVGAAGRVRACEVDEALAAGARANLASMPWVDVRTGNGREPLDETFDAILINAGVTHPLDAWLDALAPGGRMIVPITASLGSTIGKGLLILLTRGTESDAFGARLIGFIAIYNAVGLRDEDAGRQLAAAMQKHPFPPLTRLRRDAHEPSPSCWLHRGGACLGTG